MEQEEKEQLKLDASTPRKSPFSKDSDSSTGLLQPQDPPSPVSLSLPRDTQKVVRHSKSRFSLRNIYAHFTSRKNNSGSEKSFSQKGLDTSRTSETQDRLSENLVALQAAKLEALDSWSNPQAGKPPEGREGYASIRPSGSLKKQVDVLEARQFGIGRLEAEDLEIDLVAKPEVKTLLDLPALEVVPEAETGEAAVSIQEQVEPVELSGEAALPLVLPEEQNLSKSASPPITPFSFAQTNVVFLPPPLPPLTLEPVVQETETSPKVEEEERCFRCDSCSIS